MSDRIKREYLKIAFNRVKCFVKKFESSLDIPTRSYLDIAKWVASKTFWGFILTYFWILTTVSCLELFSQYINGLTTSKIDIINGEPFTFPPSTVCLPLYGVGFEYLDKKFDTSNKSQYLKFKMNEYCELSVSNKDKFLKASRLKASPDVLLVVFNYLSNLYFTENYRTSTTSSTFLQYAKMWRQQYWWEALIILEENIQKLNISTHELTQSFGQAVAMWFQLHIYHYVNLNGEIHRHDYHYESILKTSVSSDWICYTVNSSKFVSNSQDEIIEIRIDGSDLKSAMHFTK